MLNFILFTFFILYPMSLIRLWHGFPFQLDIVVRASYFLPHLSWVLSAFNSSHFYFSISFSSSSSLLPLRCALAGILSWFLYCLASLLLHFPGGIIFSFLSVIVASGDFQEERKEMLIWYYYLQNRSFDKYQLLS